MYRVERVLSHHEKQRASQGGRGGAECGCECVCMYGERVTKMKSLERIVHRREMEGTERLA